MTIPYWKRLIKEAGTEVNMIEEFNIKLERKSKEKATGHARV